MALEFTLNNGKTMLSQMQAGLQNSGNFDSFESLYVEFTRQLIYMCNCAMKITDLCEAHYKQVHSAPIFSGTYTSALEKGGDLYCDYTAKYNNSSVNGIGLATAVDSLVAIKKLVYDDKIMTLDNLIEILKSNWKNQEALRLTIKNKFPKFGINEGRTDKIAKDIVDVMHKAISGKPNVKGGVYRLGLFSINWRWEFGEKTGASADGRLAGETLSQNTSAAFGADRDGATAHLLSVASIDTSKTPNGAIVDIDLHSSAVRGENGLNTLFSTLKTYFELGGFAVHYNVLDTEVLKDAKLNPEKYPNLQVRLCGWNVLFSSLSEKEKDEFIARSIK
jgi:formate C-acetyltransferase